MKLAILAFALSSLALAQHAPSTLPKVKFTDTKLDNGLRVLISEDHYAPVYAICVAYKAGSKDERPGRTGFAHLFEHMMFKGSENVGMGELDFLIYTNGGSSNGTTDNDRTSSVSYTHLSLIPSASPISLLLWPFTISSSTSISRRLNSECGGRSARLFEMDAGMYFRPECTVRMAFARS